MPADAVPETVYIHSEEVSDVAYVTGRLRVKVKAIGSLGVSGGVDRPGPEVDVPPCNPDLPSLDQVSHGSVGSVVSTQ